MLIQWKRYPSGVLVYAAHGSIDWLRHLYQKLTDAQKSQLLITNNLTNHFKPSPNNVLHSYLVTKQGRSWNANFQLQ